jgi:putative aminopeptidase
MKDRLIQDTTDLMRIPGLSGHEDRVRAAIRAKLDAAGVSGRTDRMGNLIVSFIGSYPAPSVMVFAHMDSLGFFVRKIDNDGLIRVERMGGVPERALAAQPVTLCGSNGDVPGIITNKSHHATAPEENYTVLKTPEITIDTGHASRAAVEAAGIRVGTPVVYRPAADTLAADRITGTTVDDRAGCAVLIELARILAADSGNLRTGPTVHLVWSVQEEFNLRGAQVAAQILQPDIAIQIDLMLATDTPDMADRGDMVLGGGPGMSLYSFHGRGTLNGTIPHPAIVRLIEDTADAQDIPLQRSAQVGVLTDTSYVQLVGQGVACIDLGFPCRYTHSANEVCDANDLAALTRLIDAAIRAIPAEMRLERD